MAASFRARSHKPSDGCAVKTQNGIASTSPSAKGRAQTTGVQPRPAKHANVPMPSSVCGQNCRAASLQGTPRSPRVCGTQAPLKPMAMRMVSIVLESVLIASISKVNTVSNTMPVSNRAVPP